MEMSYLCSVQKYLLVCFSLLTKYQTVETHEVVVQPQIQTWMKTDRANAFEIPSPFVVGVFKPVTSICEQVW